jgi:plasmid maintenance system antidote protein VapI
MQKSTPKTPTKDNGQILNREWFLEKLKDKNKSLRGLARHFSIDPSAASRIFSHGRKMQIDEADKMAEFLEISVQEVLHHAGVTIDAGPPKAMSIVEAKQGLAATFGVDESAITITISI